MTVVNTNIAETINITTNGEYNVARYTTANVNTPAAPAHYIEFNVDGNGKAQYSSQIADFTGITDIIDYLFAYQYWGNTAISGAVDMSDLTTISGQSACRYMFDGCTGITIVDLSSLTTISGVSACQYMFQYCTGITSVDLSGLTTISGNQACQYMFSDCTGITSMDLSSLTTISGNQACQTMFYGCTRITSVDLSSLTTISGGSACTSMFYGCTSLATVYIGGTIAIDFGTYTNQFDSMFFGCTQNIDVYAPAANQTQIESFSGYPNFGGTGTVTWHWNTAE